MKKLLLILALLIPFYLLSCTSATSTTTTQGYTPTVISAETGQFMMENNSEIILVDVRTPSEFAEEHIPGAINLNVETISTTALSAIPNKAAIYILYCHTGNRSGQAATILSDMGYAFIYDMGGIIDWPYDTVSGTN